MLEQLDPADLRRLLNKHKVREHLIDHELFDSDSLAKWMRDKHNMDCTSGCRVRGITSDNILAGWCGIQYIDDRYEIAIVLDDKFWGTGKKVFDDILSWAKELGHKEVYIHLPQSRPQYKFLCKISSKVSESHMFGHRFTTYQINVDQVMQ